MSQMLQMADFEIVKCWNYSLNPKQIADRNLNEADNAIPPHTAHTSLIHSTAHCPKV